MTQLNSTLTTALETIARRRFVFVHQSVGRDVLRGVSELCEGAGVQTPPILDATSTVEGATGILHARLGRNREPLTKLAAFRDLMAGPLGQSADVATVKLCYVDINASTDVHKLYEELRETLNAVSTTCTRTQVFAMTVPLTTVESSLIATVRQWLGRPCTERDNNLRREEFNQLLREQFGTRGLLFDLAATEATSESGALSEFSWKGRKAPSLYAPYTSDGGHLNDRGRLHVAARLIEFLGSVGIKQQPLEKE
jgi:hypothetical protein